MIDRLYRYDSFVIIGFILLMWAILAIVLTQVVALLEENIVRAIAVSSALAVGIFSTASLVAVLVHLKQKKRMLYGEDVDNLLILRSTGSGNGIPAGPANTEVLLKTEI